LERPCAFKHDPIKGERLQLTIWKGELRETKDKKMSGIEYLAWPVIPGAAAYIAYQLEQKVAKPTEKRRALVREEVADLSLDTLSLDDDSSCEEDIEVSLVNQGWENSEESRSFRPYKTVVQVRLPFSRPPSPNPDDISSILIPML